MATKRTGRPRGRPRKPRPQPPSREEKLAQKFLRDPDRFGVAMLDAMLAFKMASERDCAQAITTMLVGVEGDPPRLNPEGLVVTNWERYRTKVGATAATLEGRASTLRIKQDKCRSTAEGVWRKHMAGAFMLAIGARDREAVKAAITERVMGSGELDLARAILILWRMVDALQVHTPPPEFPAEIVST